jgi:putative membrane protein
VTGMPTLVLAHGTRPDQSPWRWDLHLDVAAVMVVLIGLYVLALKAVGSRVLGPGEPLLDRRQRWLLGTALGLLWAFSAWPVHNLAEGFSYTVHMVQHSVYTLVVPPLLILGTPEWLWRWALRPVLPVARRLLHPWVAVAVYSAVTTATHLPVLADSAVGNGFSHFAQHVALVVSAVIVWWPLAGRLPELPRVRSAPSQMVYLFFLSLAPSVAGSFRIWASSPFYRAYEPFPHLFGLSTLDDQQTGGVVMELVEGLVIWGLIVLVMLRVARRDLRPPEDEDRTPSDDDGPLVDQVR